MDANLPPNDEQKLPHDEQELTPDKEQDCPSNDKQNPPSQDNASMPANPNGKWRIIIAGLLFVLLIAGGGYYGHRMGFFKETPGKVESEPLEEPVKPVEIPSNITNMPEEEQFSQAGKSKEELAYAIYQHIINTSASAEHKSKAQFFQAALLSQYLKKPQQAKTKFKELIKKYPQSDYVDDAYYNLGLIYLDQNHLKEAVYNFTSVIDNYPNSNQIENAKFMATKCSNMLAEMKQQKKEKPFDLVSLIKELAPGNLLSLIAFICALGAPSVWIMLRVHDSQGQLVLFASYPDSPEMRRNKKIQWIMVITFFSLISISFFINQHQKQEEFNTLLKTLQASGIKTSQK